MKTRIPIVGNSIYGIVNDISLRMAVENPQTLYTLKEARLLAAQAFKYDPKSKPMHVIVLMADARVCLWRFGPRGGRQRVWTFGQLQALQNHFKIS